ncbi:MAG: hypothetical protein HC822_15195 [Oscillochloris sp.]|nr:hypothetical protein [Oscillochloris sp.]
MLMELQTAGVRISSGDSDRDRAFAPAQEHSRDRWLSIAVARRRSIGLPPVQLIHGADGYYVRDGHQRISVARALGEAFIEAVVK